MATLSSLTSDRTALCTEAMAARDLPLLSTTRVLGHLTEARQDIIALLERFNRERGDIGRLRFGWSSLVVLNTPDLAGELLVDNHARVRKSRFVRASLHP